ncbi:DUF853 family protein [Candidatus Micrarchaeota archaeon]|nr:DUF853 family protein [Candidatus Micrarchaeota archaeon]
MIDLGVSGKSVISIPENYLTRHGLIAGSTGSGKSRTMQVIAEQLADNGTNVFVSDVKGDASGFCIEGKDNKRNALAGYRPHGIETNYWSISDRFIQLRFSLQAAGSVLLSRMLSLNPTQESHLSLVFAYARKNGLPLDSLENLLDVLDEMLERKERGMSRSSVNVIERKILAMQESGIGSLFGKPGLQLNDFSGMNVLNLSDSRKNMLVSIAPAFLLQLLFEKLPEVGDVEKPKYAIFFDEAHYLFKDSNKSLRDLMVTILKQIRSKGVSVFFVTQDVTDLPDEILGQLSTKIIFSQKVFTQKGNKKLNALATSFPKSDIDVMERLKRLSPGVAIVSTLDGNGNQTEPGEVTMFAPATAMEVIDDPTLLEASDPKLIEKYSRKKPVKKPKSEKEIRTAIIREKPELKQSHETSKTTENKTNKPKKRGPAFYEGIFRFLLKLLDFMLKVIGKLFSAIILKPIKIFLKYLARKPVRIIYFILLLIVIYVIYLNWDLIGRFPDSLDFSQASHTVAYSTACIFLWCR